jgi:hypothetical protein
MANKPPMGDRTQKTDPKSKEDVYVVNEPIAPDAASAPKPKPKAPPPQKYAKGGFVRAADGCAQRGKTKGRIV